MVKKYKTNINKQSDIKKNTSGIKTDAVKSPQNNQNERTKNMPNIADGKKMLIKKSKTDDSVSIIAVDPNQSAPDIQENQNIKLSKKFWIILAVAAVLLITTGTVYGYYLFNKPEAFFPQSDTPQQSPKSTASGYIPEEIEEEVSFSGIVNIMLFGIDSNPERKEIAENNPDATKSDMHSDTMIILAINFEKDTVDMISLPRDTYANIPGVKGYYKLNAAINCGEKPYPDESSIKKLLEAAEWMLGSTIPIDYYIGIDMPVLIDLVDAIGGVDYDVDIDFAGNVSESRVYSKGMQHMDGLAVLDYLRTRNSRYTEASELGDINRIRRQKNMLLTIFKKLKNEGSLSQIPKILQAFDGRMSTNLSISQIATLTNWSYKLDDNNIGMHAMDGVSRPGLFLWNFIVTNQEKRVELIKEIYGVDVPEYVEYSPKYVTDLWNQMAGPYARSNAMAFYNKYNIPIDETETPDTDSSESPGSIFSPFPSITGNPFVSRSPGKSPGNSPSPSKSPGNSPSPSRSPGISPSPSRSPGNSPDLTDTPSVSQPEVLPPISRQSPPGGDISVIGENLLLNLNIKDAKPKPTNIYEKCFTEKEREKVASVLHSSDVFRIRQVCESVNRFGFKFGSWGPNVMISNQIKVNPN